MEDVILIQPKGEFLERLQKKPYMPLGLLQISSGIYQNYKVNYSTKNREKFSLIRLIDMNTKKRKK